MLQSHTLNKAGKTLIALILGPRSREKVVNFYVLLECNLLL
jgi:hypothetical protein